FAMLEEGHIPVRASQARVFHPIRPARWGVSLRQQSKSRFEALLYKKHPKLYAAKIGRGPMEYYFMVGIMAAAIALQGAAQIIAACGWLAWTGAFCARRLRRNSLAPAHVAEMVWTSMLIPPLSVFWRLAGALKYRVWFW
ncbi:MAG: glycosyl transferase, family 2, partial [Prosthecobacter sp.]|nr:glycosyl transferase, family 2 [Prosthecobacter sp.]